MIKKGIILAGGIGKRLNPLTKTVNKQLLPIYNKPLIFYPVSTLMKSGIRNILIIVNKGQTNQFTKILPKKNNLGLKIKYLEQNKPRGLPDAFILGKKFIGKDKVALILGDNFFLDSSLSLKIKEAIKLKKGSTIFLKKVNNPNLYGIASINKNNKVEDLVEKPQKSVSKLAITGLYFFDNDVVKYSKTLKPSRRNELEIIDLLNKYKKNKDLKFKLLGKKSIWLDTGEFKSMNKASNLVLRYEKKNKKMLACLEEIALKNKWITKKDILKAIQSYNNCDYSNYLKKLL